jgi:hypothetical protein
MSFYGSALLLAWVAIVLLGLTVSGLVRQVHALSSGHQPERLEVDLLTGTQAPTVDGLVWDRQRTNVLLFVDASCHSCAQVLPYLDTLSEETTSDTAFTALFVGHDGGFRTDHVRVLTRQASAFEQYQVPLTPFGVKVSSEGVLIAAAPIGSDKMLKDFVERGGRGGSVT